MTEVPEPDQPPRDRPGRRGLIEAVAEQIAEVTADVTKLRTNTRGNAELLAESLTRLRGLEETVATLAGRVDVLAEVEEDDTGRLDPAVLDALGLAAKPGTPWCWPAMDAKTAATAWVQLARFVGEVLTARHPITRQELPDCWAAHPHVVDTLSWLRTTWRVAHVGRAPAAAAAEWGTRWLPGAWKAIAEGMDNDCGPGYHLAPFPIRNVFEQRHRWDARPAQAGSMGMFKHSGEDPGLVQQQRETIRQVLEETAPGRPRVMNVDELVDRDRQAAAANERSRPDLWLPVWRDAAAADVARRQRSRPPEPAYDL